MLMAASVVRENMKAAEEDRLPDDELLAQMGYVTGPSSHPLALD